MYRKRLRVTRRFSYYSSHIYFVCRGYMIPWWECGGCAYETCRDMQSETHLGMDTRYTLPSFDAARSKIDFLVFVVKNFSKDHHANFHNFRFSLVASQNVF